MENRGGLQFFEPSKREGYEKNDRKRGSHKKISHHDREGMLQYYVLREYKPFMKIVTCNYFLTYSSTSIKWPQGLVHGFWQKIEVFIISVFWGKSSQTRSFLIFWIKKNAVKTRKRKFFKKKKKIGIFQRG